MLQLLHHLSPVPSLRRLVDVMVSPCHSSSVFVKYAHTCALRHESTRAARSRYVHAEGTNTHNTSGDAFLPCFLLFLTPYVRVELNRVLDVWVVFLCPKRLTNCCCPEQKQPLHCLSICAQPYQRFNTYCFKLHQSLPSLPSHSPSSLGSFFSVSFYYFASSSFSPLTSLHIILTLVAFSSFSYSILSSLTPFAPICLISSLLSLSPLLPPAPLSLSSLDPLSYPSPSWHPLHLPPCLPSLSLCL